MVSIERFELSARQASNLLLKFGLSCKAVVRRLAKGMINDVFVVDKYVIKVNTGHPDLLKLEKEFALYTLLKSQGVPVPDVYGHDNSREIVPYECMVMEYVPGEEFSREKHALANVGKVLAQIHSIQFSQFGERFVNGSFAGESNFNEYMSHYVGGIADELRKTGVLPQDRILKIQKFFTEDELFNISPPPSLLHGNFIFDNLIMNDEIEAVVDWEWARTGHNEEEVATFLYRVLKMNKSDVDPFLKGYEAVIPLVAHFTDRIHAYALLYYVRVLPSVPKWTHRPDKQREYYEETEKLFEHVIG